MSKIEHPLLRSFCAPDHAASRYGIKVPWTADGFLWATDGRRCFRQKWDGPEMKTENPPPTRDLGWDEAAMSQVDCRLPFDDFRNTEKCNQCGGKGKTNLIECPDCNGFGEVECECCGQDTECDRCDGDGKIKADKDGNEVDCDDCGGRGFHHEPNLAKIGDAWIQAQWARPVDAAGAKWYGTKANRPVLAILDDDCRLLIMPMQICAEYGKAAGTAEEHESRLAARSSK